MPDEMISREAAEAADRHHDLEREAQLQASEDFMPIVASRPGEILVGQTISFDGIAIGSIEEGLYREPWLFLDLGWCRAAGLHFSISGDRSLDHRHKIIER